MQRFAFDEAFFPDIVLIKYKMLFDINFFYWILAFRTILLMLLNVEKP